MQVVYYKICIIVVLSVPYLCGSQESPCPGCAAAASVQAERTIMAELEEVDLCRRIFGLQAECELEHPQLYTFFGGFVGVCAAIIKCSRTTNLGNYSSKLCGLAAAGALGAFVGSIVRLRMQAKKTARILTERTLHYFPEEYMASIQGKLEHGQEVSIHRFKSSEGREAVREEEIRQWHSLATSNHSSVCYNHLETGQLIAILPYYSPEVRELYRWREEELELARPKGTQPSIPINLSTPISYYHTQELNPLHGRSADWWSLVSLLYSHDTRQDAYACYDNVRTRIVALSMLGKYIQRGHLR